MSALVFVLSSRVAAGGSGRSKNPVALLLVGVLFTLVGTMGAINPRWQWRMSRWAYKNPEANEPSDRAFAVRRWLAVPILVVGIAIIVVAISQF